MDTADELQNWRTCGCAVCMQEREVERESKAKEQKEIAAMNPAEITCDQNLDELVADYHSILTSFERERGELSVDDVPAILQGNTERVNDLFGHVSERFVDNQKRVVSFARRCIKEQITVSDQYYWLGRLIQSFPLHEDKILKAIIIYVRED